MRNAPTCPVCGKPQSPSHKPFCSRHCADIDLGRWLNQSYVVPGAAETEKEPPNIRNLTEASID